MPDQIDTTPEKPLVPEPVVTPSESEVKEPTPAELLVAAQATIATERTAREKAERDLSSLRGTVRSQRELEDIRQAETAGTNKTLELLVKGLSNPDSAQRLPAEFAELRNQQNIELQNALLKRDYAMFAEEFEKAIQGDDGKPIFDIDTAPELADARQFWNRGKEDPNLPFDSRRASFIRGVAEATKAAALYERKKLREEREMEKTQRAADRKKKIEDSGELDLDTGAGGSRPSVKSWAQAQKIKKTSDLSDKEYEKLIAG